MTEKVKTVLYAKVGAESDKELTNAVQIQGNLINKIKDERVGLDRFESEIEDGFFELDVTLLDEKTFKRDYHNEVAESLYTHLVDHPSDGMTFEHSTNTVGEPEDGGDGDEQVEE